MYRVFFTLMLKKHNKYVLLNTNLKEINSGTKYGITLYFQPPAFCLPCLPSEMGRCNDTVLFVCATRVTLLDLSKLACLGETYLFLLGFFCCCVFNSENIIYFVGNNCVISNTLVGDDISHCPIYIVCPLLKSFTTQTHWGVLCAAC